MVFSYCSENFTSVILGECHHWYPYILFLLMKVNHGCLYSNHFEMCSDTAVSGVIIRAG